jgi:hypothetical protein
MVIRYGNGFSFEAVLLSRDGQSMRVAIEGSDDVLSLTEINGAWVTDDCELVQVELARTRPSPWAGITEKDCVCSHDLAARLIHLLFAGENEPEAAPVEALTAVVCHHVV